VDSSHIHQLGAVSLRSTGEDTPLFLVHEVYGEFLAWGTRLTRSLDKNIPVYGLAAEPPANLTLRTMQGMAARLVQAIRAIQPKGPYRIAGWSFGGMLAYEVAAQLISNDDQVEFLGLLDTRVHILDAELHDAAILKRLILNNYSSPGIIEEVDTVDSTDLDALWQKYQELSLVPENLFSLSMADLRLYFSRYRTHIQALKAYEIQPINIPIHLFIAQDDVADDLTHGWSKVLPAACLSLIPVPGSHGSMMDEPNVITLGRELSRCLHKKSEAISPKERHVDANKSTNLVH
jgi:arthrofactin-type cyclic lipopeptide synthetase C